MNYMQEQVIKIHWAQASLDISVGVSWNGKLEWVCCMVGSTAMKHLLQEKAASERTIHVMTSIPQSSCHFCLKTSKHRHRKGLM